MTDNRLTEEEMTQTPEKDFKDDLRKRISSEITRLKNVPDNGWITHRMGQIDGLESVLKFISE